MKTANQKKRGLSSVCSCRGMFASAVTEVGTGESGETAEVWEAQRCHLLVAPVGMKLDYPFSVFASLFSALHKHSQNTPLFAQAAP